MLYQSTDHARAFTTETLRRSEISRQAVRLPPFIVYDANGQAHDLAQWLAQDHRILITDFIYTNCQTVCSALGGIYQQLQQKIEAKHLAPKIGLLSISFDPEHDDAKALTNYAKRMQSHSPIWQVVSLKNPQDRQKLLDTFGVMVIPAPNGEFEHNGAFHIIKDGQLIQILDYDDFDQLLSMVESLP